MFTYSYFLLASHREFIERQCNTPMQEDEICIGVLPCLSVDRSCFELQAPSSNFFCIIVPQKSTTNDHNDQSDADVTGIWSVPPRDDKLGSLPTGIYT